MVSPVNNIIITFQNTRATSGNDNRSVAANALETQSHTNKIKSLASKCPPGFLLRHQLVHTTNQPTSRPGNQVTIQPFRVVGGQEGRQSGRRTGWWATGHTCRRPARGRSDGHKGSREGREADRGQATGWKAVSRQTGRQARRNGRRRRMEAGMLAGGHEGRRLAVRLYAGRWACGQAGWLAGGRAGTHTHTPLS